MTYPGFMIFLACIACMFAFISGLAAGDCIKEIKKLCGRMDNVERNIKSIVKKIQEIATAPRKS